MNCCTDLYVTLCVGLENQHYRNQLLLSHHLYDGFLTESV